MERDWAGDAISPAQWMARGRLHRKFTRFEPVLPWSGALETGR